MNTGDRSSHSHVDRRTVLKATACASALAIASGEPVSSAVLANNNEIVGLTARAAVDYIRRGELSAERYAQALLERQKAHANLNAVAYMDEARLLEDARAVDRSRAQGARLGVLAGLPIILRQYQHCRVSHHCRNIIPQGLPPQSQRTARRFVVQAGRHPVCKIQHARACIGKHERESDIRIC